MQFEHVTEYDFSETNKGNWKAWLPHELRNVPHLQYMSNKVFIVRFLCVHSSRRVQCIQIMSAMKQNTFQEKNKIYDLAQ